MDRVKLKGKWLLQCVNHTRWVTNNSKNTTTTTTTTTTTK